jgi:GH35 family endo-1,4-beta-xylanase
MPADVYGLRDDLPALDRRVKGHLTDVVWALRGRLVEWDVVNEPTWYDALITRLGRAQIVEWYRLVRALDPRASLYINEYGVIPGSDYTAERYEETIAYLVANAAPLHGIGLQAHFTWSLTAPSRVYATLDRFAAFRLPLSITELDIDITDDQAQAEYLDDFLTVAFSHPAVVSIILWGFWEGHHWRPNAALYRTDWSIKPCGRVWRDLVRSAWWTDVAGVTDGDGRFSGRGFRGQHLLTVTTASGQRDIPLILPADGLRATVTP